MGWAHCTMHGVVLVQGMRTNLCQQNARPGCQQAHTLKHHSMLLCKWTNPYLYGQRLMHWTCGCDAALLAWLSCMHLSHDTVSRTYNHIDQTCFSHPVTKDCGMLCHANGIQASPQMCVCCTPCLELRQSNRCTCADVSCSRTAGVAQYCIAQAALSLCLQLARTSMEYQQ